MRRFRTGFLESFLALMLLLVVDYMVWRLFQHLIEGFAHYDGVNLCLVYVLLPVLFSLLIVLWIVLVGQLLVSVGLTEDCRSVLYGPLAFHLAVL